MKQVNAPKPVRLDAITIAHSRQTCAGEGQTCSSRRTDMGSLYIIYGQPVYFHDSGACRCRAVGFSSEVPCHRKTTLDNPLGIPSQAVGTLRKPNIRQPEVAL